MHRLPAQERVPAPGHIGMPERIVAPGGEQILVVPTIPYEPALVDPMPWPFAPPRRPTPAYHHLMQLANKHGVGCESNSPWGSCSNFHYEMNFIFGSCRWFFYEQCWPCQHGSQRYIQR
jgi:hypothetical protein